MKKTDTRSIKLILLILCAMIAVCSLAFFINRYTAKAENCDAEIDYSFEDVPVENIAITNEMETSEVRPGDSISVSFELTPWYTTADRVYFDILPFGAAEAVDVSSVNVKNGRASGSAIITVSPQAEVGSVFSVVASVNGVQSNSLDLTVAKIPVERIKLGFADSDDKLHIGKSKQVLCEVLPLTATNKSIEYELSGTGVKYIKDFDESTGVLTAISDIHNVDANSTVIVTGYSQDDPAVSDSIVISLYVPTIDVEISATTPAGGKTSDNITLAVANSTRGGTVSLSATVNGVNATGLNYVIVEGQEYIENGLIRSDGSFTLKSTKEWTDDMRQPHAQIRVRAAYSDGFDEIGISVYVPVEKISFVGDDVPLEVENNRSYDLRVQAFPEYATFLNDCADPFVYTLNGLDSGIASINDEGLLSLPKSLTSKGSTINYSAYLNGAWKDVDAAPFSYSMKVIPVYANKITRTTIYKDGVPITDKSVTVIPSDELNVEVEYDKDNVTEVDFELLENSDMISTSESSISIAPLSAMTEDNPYIPVTLSFDSEVGKKGLSLYIPIYVPAISAIISGDLTFERDKSLDLKPYITINGHDHASNKSITWGDAIIQNGNGLRASCDNGILSISCNAKAGTKVEVYYKTADGEDWQVREFTVSPLGKNFKLSYTATNGYTVNVDAPQLEEGQSVGIKLNYNGKSGKKFGLSYTVKVTGNATLLEQSNNDLYDLFTLSAISGQSGRNNNIGYLIEIEDGTSTYYIGTDNFNSGFSEAEFTKTKNIAVFNRISGKIDVSNPVIEKDGYFDLTGWDSLATFDEDKLVWTVNGSIIQNRKLTVEPDSGFVLGISAAQPYNDTAITFAAEISFSSIIYKSESDAILRKEYKKSGENAVLAYILNEDKDDCVQTGWSTVKNGSKDYELSSLYCENSDIILYPYWSRKVVNATMGSAFETEDFLPTSFCDWRSVDDITGYFNSYTSVDALKRVGFTTVTVSINLHVSIYGDVEMYLQIYDATSEIELCGSDLYHSPNGTSFDTTYVFTFDISWLDDTHEIALRFKGRRYVAVWGGGVTLSADRQYNVTFNR